MQHSHHSIYLKQAQHHDDEAILDDTHCPRDLAANIRCSNLQRTRRAWWLWSTSWPASRTWTFLTLGLLEPGTPLCTTLLRVATPMWPSCCSRLAAAQQLRMPRARRRSSLHGGDKSPPPARLAFQPTSRHATAPTHSIHPMPIDNQVTCMFVSLRRCSFAMAPSSTKRSVCSMPQPARAAR